MNFKTLPNFKASKPLKLLFQNQVCQSHRVPTNYLALVQSTLLAFQGELKENFSLQYEDSDGDYIMLTTEQDYQAMLEYESETPSKSIKVFVLADGEQIPKKIPKTNSSFFESLQEDDLCHSTHQKRLESKDKMRTNDQYPLKRRDLGDHKAASVDIQEKREPLADVHTEDKSTTDNTILECQTQAREESNNKIEDPTLLNVHPPEKCSSRQRLKKREEDLKSSILETLADCVPLIAEVVQNGNKQFSSQQNQEFVQKVTAKKRKIVSHYQIICTGCGKNPIKGIRYQCSICEELNYCEKCESLTEHDHPFLKIKHPSQSPQLLVAILEEELSNAKKIDHLRKSVANKVSHFSKEIQDQVSFNVEEIIKKLVQDSHIQEIIDEVPKNESPQDKMEHTLANENSTTENKPLDFDSQFLKEISTTPTRITTNDRIIYKAVSLKNTGINEWPIHSFVHNVGGEAGPDVRVVGLEPGEDFSCVLQLKNPKKPGEYTSSWILAYFDIEGRIHHIGEIFTLKFTVLHPEPYNTNIQDEKPERSIDLLFLKEICTIPARLTIEDKVIYKTVSLKNSGKGMWPENSFLKNIAGVTGKDTEIHRVNPGDQFSSILILENPGKPGIYMSSWRLAYYDNNNNLRYGGHIFTVTFQVFGIDEEAVVEKPEKTYPKRMIDLALEVQEMFPNANVEALVEFIANYPDTMTLEELVEEYMNFFEQ